MQAVCNAYPPGRETAFKCDGLPRPGYSLECADVQQGLRQVLARHRRELRWHARLGAARRAAVAPRAQATTPDSLAPLHVALPAAFPLSPAPFPRFRGKGGSFLQVLGEPWGREAGCSTVSLHRVAPLALA